MTNDTNEALAALVRRLRDPWNHSEDLCEEAADMLPALAEKLAEAEALALEMELRHQRALTRLHEVEADADRLAEVLTFYRDTWRVVKNKRGLLEWRPQEGLLDDCGNQANDALATLADALEAERAKRQRAEAERDQALARLAAVQRETVERCAALLIELGYVSESGETLAKEVRGLRLDPDAQAALDKLLAEARLEGWRAGRDAAAEHCWEKRSGLADAEQKQVAAGLTGRDYYGRRLEAELLSRSIRALPEPKEASHD